MSLVKRVLRDNERLDVWLETNRNMFNMAFLYMCAATVHVIVLIIIIIIIIIIIVVIVHSYTWMGKSYTL